MTAVVIVALLALCAALLVWAVVRTRTRADELAPSALAREVGTLPSRAEFMLIDDGLVVRGPAEDVALFVAEIQRAPGRERQAPQSLFDTAATLASGAGVVQAHSVYFKMSASSLAALRGAYGGEVPTSWFAGVTRGGLGQISKHLDLKKINIGPEQLLSIQMAATTLALRMAIAEVKQAVERVEGKVEEVDRLLRAERLGAALGDQRTLSGLVDQLDSTGSISATDWSAVASMGPLIGRDAHALREHVRLTIEREVSAWTGSRLDAAETILNDAKLRETLALLALVEQNHNLWQVLRLARVSQAEPEHLEATLAAARAAVVADAELDQQLVQELDGMLASLMSASGLEGLSPLQAPKLKAAGDELDQVVQWFADQRLLDRVPLEVTEWPGMKDSIGHVAATLKSSAREVIGRRNAEAALDAVDGAAELPPVRDGGGDTG